MIKTWKGKLLMAGVLLTVAVLFFFMTLIVSFATAFSNETGYEARIDMEDLPTIITQEMIVGAMESEEEYGVPASLTLAQIILESSGTYPGGLSQLAYECNNLFGMKGIGPAGSKTYMTVEQTADGQKYTVTAHFRKYHNVKESIDDHGQLLSSTFYLQYVASCGDDADLWAKAIHKAGYATDANYSNLLIQLMQEYNLYRYNHGGNIKPGDGIAHGHLMWPTISSAIITSYYGYRPAPTAGASTFHEGIDIAAASGSAIYAADGGTVREVGWNGSAGNYIILDHGKGMETWYLHLRNDGVLVVEGMKVSRGQHIGKMGSTGISTGDHLDFRININGTFKNPLDYVSQP